MNILELIVYIFATGIVGVTIFTVLWWLRTKKLPPTDEPVVGEYRIEVDVGSHIVPFEGTLYYFNKLLNVQHLRTYAKTLEENGEESDLDEVKRELKEKAHLYAMRLGTKKLAFISLYHPVEIRPFFKSEQGTGRKIVHATGTIGKSTKGFQHITMEPIDLSSCELNPRDYEAFDKVGKLLTTLLEKAPLIEQIEAKEEQLRIVRNKADEFADELARKEDESQYWKELYKKKGAAPPAEKEGISVPPIIKNLLFFGVLFAIGYGVSSAILQLVEYQSVLVGLGSVVGGFIVKRVLGK